MKEESSYKKKFWIMFLILGLLFIFSALISLMIGGGEPVIDYNTAVIPINGPITVDSGSGWFSEATASSTDIIELIDKAKDDPNVKAIIFEINSPGGSPVATDEIAMKIKSLEEDNLTTVAWIREVGASGAYWRSEEHS